MMLRAITMRDVEQVEALFLAEGIHPKYLGEGFILYWLALGKSGPDIVKIATNRIVKES